MVAGAAERALGQRHRALVHELRAAGLPDRPRYDTTSAFRFVYDPTASRDLADTSAVAAEAGVAVRAITEQPLAPPSPPVGQSVRRVEPSSPVAPLTPVAPSPAAPVELRAGTGLLAAGPDGGGLGVLSRPAAAAAWEKADQACRALANGWQVEANELFLAAAEQAPTDPFAWFGAGVAASRFDPSAGAGYLVRASRYLLADDPAASVYATIAAAGLMEQAGEVDGAVGLLEQRLDELSQPCPSLLLHLARLGSEPDTRVAAALLVDPLMEVDVRALGLDRSGRAAVDRRARTELEVRRLDGSITALRGVAGRHPRLELASGQGPNPAAASSDLGLVRAEVELWRRHQDCTSEIERASDAVGRRQRARRAVESDLAAANELADTDLGYRNTVPFFLFSLGAALAVVVLFVIGRLATGAPPILELMTTSLIWVSQAAIVVLTARQFLKVWWPRRAYARARQVKATTIPDLAEQVSRHREAEFNLRRRYNLVHRDADLRLARVVDRRRSLAPERPRPA